MTADIRLAPKQQPPPESPTIVESSGKVVAASFNTGTDSDRDAFVSINHTANLIEVIDQLRPGQIVCGQAGNRPRIRVPHGGLIVRTEELCFRNIDFVPNGTRPDHSTEPAMLHVEASQAAFEGCSFQVPNGQRRIAIRCSRSDDRLRYETGLPTGRIRLMDCVFRNVEAAIACRTAGAFAVEFANVLHLGPGPLVSLSRCPRLDEPVALTLTAMTLRNSGPLLECRYDHVEHEPGRVLIRAAGCAFALTRDTPLLSFVGTTPPERMLQAVDWTGQGSVVVPENAIAGWRDQAGSLIELDDSSVSIAGLVRSQVAFVGPAASGPHASRVTRWQGPLLSTDAPGIDPQRLTCAEFDNPSP
jgi:hypothetical protein